MIYERVSGESVTLFSEGDALDEAFVYVLLQGEGMMHGVQSGLKFKADISKGAWECNARRLCAMRERVSKECSNPRPSAEVHRATQRARRPPERVLQS